MHGGRILSGVHAGLIDTEPAKTSTKRSYPEFRQHLLLMAGVTGDSAHAGGLRQTSTVNQTCWMRTEGVGDGVGTAHADTAGDQLSQDGLGRGDLGLGDNGSRGGGGSSLRLNLKNANRQCVCWIAVSTRPKIVSRIGAAAAIPSGPFLEVADELRTEIRVVRFGSKGSETEPDKDFCR